MVLQGAVTDLILIENLDILFPIDFCISLGVWIEHLLHMKNVTIINDYIVGVNCMVWTKY